MGHTRAAASFLRAIFFFLLFSIVLWLIGIQTGVLRTDQIKLWRGFNCSRNTTEVMCKECINKKQDVEPWYAAGQVWHYPVRFPRCSMDACFNYTRCYGQQDLLIYAYQVPSGPVRYFSKLQGSKWHTRDPSKACLFLVFLDNAGPKLPFNTQQFSHWDGGLNHVLVTFADMWAQKGPPPDTIGKAALMASQLHQTISRPGFDVSISLPGKRHFPHLQATKPFKRKYMLTFRGLRYLAVHMASEGVFRSHATFRGMHNGQDVIVATSCKHPVNEEHRQKDPTLWEHCEEDEAQYKRYSFSDLMNTTFGLVPAGISPNSYRLAEVLSAGAVPVLIADNYVKPFEGLLQWHRCILQFPTTQMHRILGVVRSMPPSVVACRQQHCIRIYQTIFKNDDSLFAAAIASLQARFMGAVPSNVTKFDLESP